MFALIPTLTRSTAEFRKELESEIMSVYRHANTSQRARGGQWYRVAHELASLLADGDVARGAGVIAALSANKAWDMNQRLAARAFQGDVSGHVGDALRKVGRIMGGERPEDVLPMSLKTGNFYRCILDPTDYEPVVIDRHAHDLAVGRVYGNNDRGLGVPGRYALLSLAYRNAAASIGILPSALQATTWVYWTESNAGRDRRPTLERYEHV